MSNNAVGWFEIYVQDMVRAKTFYEAVFAVRLERLENPDIELWSFPMQSDGPGASGALAKMEGFPSGGNNTIVYFTCEDCSTLTKRVAENGGSIFKDKFSVGEKGFIALVIDSEGNMIGLHSKQ